MPNIELISQTNLISEYSQYGKNTMWYLVNGKLTLTLNGFVYNLRENNLALISPEDFYYINKNELTYYNAVCFKVVNTENFSLQSKIINLEYQQIELLNSIISAKDYIDKQTLLELLMILTNKSNNNVLSITNQKNRLFSKAVGLMERYITASFSAAEFADMLDISLSSLKRIFTLSSGMGVHEYFLMLKIKKAKQILLSGDSVTHTAKVLNFSSQAYFSATFKRLTGISAKSYSMGRTTEEIKQKVHVKTKHTVRKTSDLPDYLL